MPDREGADAVAAADPDGVAERPVGLEWAQIPNPYGRIVHEDQGANIVRTVRDRLEIFEANKAEALADSVRASRAKAVEAWQSKVKAAEATRAKAVEAWQSKVKAAEATRAEVLLCREEAVETSRAEARQCGVEAAKVSREEAQYRRAAE